MRLDWHLEWWMAPIWDLVNEGTANWRVQSAHLPRHHCAVVGSSSPLRPLPLLPSLPSRVCFPDDSLLTFDSFCSSRFQELRCSSSSSKAERKFSNWEAEFFLPIFLFLWWVVRCFFYFIKGFFPSIAPLIGYSVPICFCLVLPNSFLAFCLFVFSSLGAKSFPRSDYGKLV